MRKLWKCYYSLILQLCTRHFGTTLFYFFHIWSCCDSDLTDFFFLKTFFSGLSDINKNNIVYVHKLNQTIKQTKLYFFLTKHTISTLLIRNNNQTLTYSPGKGENTELKALKWYTLNSLWKSLLLYVVFSNYQHIY